MLAALAQGLLILKWPELQRSSVGAWNTRLGRLFQSHPVTGTLDKMTRSRNPSSKEMRTQCGYELSPLFNFAMAARLREEIFESVRVCETPI